jgi:hypothetical protein
MAWLELRITGWADFQAQILDKHLAVTPALKGSYVYRGQADAAWGLEPSLTRLCRSLGLDRPKTIEVENAILRRFQARAHLYLPGHLIPEVGVLDWWTLMQHYRAPTRILDWTHSPLVALYFAVNQRWDLDGAVWLFHRHALNERSDGKYGVIPDIGLVLDHEKWFQPEEPPPRIIAFDRARLTERMVAQQGAFTIAQDVLLDHSEGMEDALPATEPIGPKVVSVYRQKVVVPHGQKKDLLRRLHLMNITAATLFPGVDGFGSELEELIRLV